MKIIVGLGNPGRRYETTPHNLGFEVIDRLARRWQVALVDQPRQKAEIGEGRVAGSPAMLVRPQTFMNLSGQAVAPLVRQRELGADDLLVITDDVNLPIGRVRIRPAGSHGGHNGLRNIIQALGEDGFSRLRVGIQPTWLVEDLVEFVLRRLPPLERGQLDEMVDLAADAAESWIREGSGPTAERFNGIRRFAEGEGA